jgi:predicted lipoprotein with Yx(FWY)xxD motif
MHTERPRNVRAVIGALAASAVAAFALAQDPMPPQMAGAVTDIALAQSSEFGPYLVDQNGRALYLFVPDAQGASTCYDDCATNWPPVLVVSPDTMPVPGEGLDATLLGTVERDDGSLQVTYNGWPLYLYMGDMEAGVANGHGLGGNWFLVDPAGNAVPAAN